MPLDKAELQLTFIPTLSNVGSVIESLLVRGLKELVFLQDEEYNCFTDLIIDQKR